MEKLKVFGGRIMVPRSLVTSLELECGSHNQVRTVVVAAGRAEAVRLLAGILGGRGWTNQLKNYWSETGNVDEAALRHRGVGVYVQRTREYTQPAEYVAIKGRVR